jgi:hypothetical protein
LSLTRVICHADAENLPSVRKAAAMPLGVARFGPKLMDPISRLKLGIRTDAFDLPMTRSERGRAMLAALPRDRVLTETDGPFVQSGGRAMAPADVPVVVSGLGLGISRRGCRSD